MKEIREEIKKLESLYRIQRENCRYYHDIRNDDALGEYWRDQSYKTMQEIIQLKEQTVRVIVGDVSITEKTNHYDYSYSYGDVSNTSETLTEILMDEFDGAKVKITIEVID